MKKIIIILSVLFLTGFVFLLIIKKADKNYSLIEKTNEKLLLKIEYGKLEPVEKLILRLGALKIPNPVARRVFGMTGGLFLPKYAEFYLIEKNKNFLFTGTAGFAGIINPGFLLGKAYKKAGLEKISEAEYRQKEGLVIKPVRSGICFTNMEALSAGKYFELKEEKSGIVPRLVITLNNKENIISDLVSRFSREKEYALFPSAGSLDRVTMSIIRKDKKELLSVDFTSKEKSPDINEKLRKDIDFLIMLSGKLLESADFEITKCGEEDDKLLYLINY